MIVSESANAGKLNAPILSLSHVPRVCNRIEARACSEAAFDYIAIEYYIYNNILMNFSR